MTDGALVTEETTDDGGRCAICGARLRRTKRGHLKHHGAFDAHHRIQVALMERDEERGAKERAEAEVARLLGRQRSIAALVAELDDELPTEAGG